MKTPKPFNYYDLLEGFEQVYCPVCALTLRDVRAFLNAHLYEYANTRETHAQFRASRGLCAVHSQQLLDFGASVLSIAILQAAVTDELRQLTAAPAPPKRWRGQPSPAAKLEPTAACLACDALLRAEQQHITTLVHYLHEAPLRQAYQQSHGVCLPHLRQALRAATPTTQAELLTLQREIWARLKSELDSFADQYDINHAAGPMGAEADSWRRALHFNAGAPELFGNRART